MKMNKFLIISLVIFSIRGEDFGIAIPDQLEQRDLDTKEGRPSAHVQGDRSDPFKKLDGDAPTIPDMTSTKDQNLSWKSKVLGSGSTAPYDHENKLNMITTRNSNIFNKIYDKGKSGFGFSYVQDSYSVVDSRGVFESTFVRSSDSVRGGTLHFEMDNNIYKGWIDLNYGFGFGVGLSQGKGSFSQSTNEESDTTFSLFTIPVDFRLGIDILENRYFKLSLNGGPSVMGLYQSRDDKDDGDFGKRLRQYSFGYFGQAKLKISMAAFSKKIITDNFISSDVTNMYLDIQARTQSFENFQDDLSITGSAFGIGFSFDYL